MTIEDLYYISTLIDDGKQVSEIPLSYSPILPELPAAEINWAYGLKDFQQSIQINPATIRPLNPELATAVFGA